MRITVQNGTNAGWRVMNARRSRDWRCPSCGAWLRYYWTKCPTDGTERPEA